MWWVKLLQVDLDSGEVRVRRSCLSVSGSSFAAGAFVGIRDFVYV